MQPEMLQQRLARGHRGAGHWKQGLPGSPRTRAEPGSHIPALLRSVGSCSVSRGVDFSHWLSYSLQLKRKDWSQQPMRERGKSFLKQPWRQGAEPRAGTDTHQSYIPCSYFPCQEQAEMNLSKLNLRGKHNPKWDSHKQVISPGVYTL